MSEFFHMGGYGAYVWSSYGITAAVLLANIVLPYLRLRSIRREIYRRNLEISAAAQPASHPGQKP